MSDPGAVETIPENLVLEPAGEDAWRAVLGGYEGVSFGGQTLGLAARAAGLSCPDRELHAFHATFLRPVPPDLRVELRVERLSEGRSLARRRVAVMREGRLLFEATASLAAGGDGAIAFQDRGPEPKPPPPEAAARDVEVARSEGFSLWAPGPIEWRWVGRPWAPPADGEPTRWGAWVRPRTPLPAADAPLHAGALLFMSDFNSNWAAQRRLGPSFSHERFISLDQAVWLHRPARWTGFWWIDSRTDVAHGGRALAVREVYDEAGGHVASIVQQALLRGGNI